MKFIAGFNIFRTFHAKRKNIKTITNIIKFKNNIIFKRHGEKCISEVNGRRVIIMLN